MQNKKEEPVKKQDVRKPEPEVKNRAILPKKNKRPICIYIELGDFE
jgi:hypothetical protein